MIIKGKTFLIIRKNINSMILNSKRTMIIRKINIDNYYLILVKPKGLYATYDQTPLNYLYTIYIQLNRMQHFALHFGHRG